MGNRGLSILTGIFEGVNESVTNLRNLKIAKEKLAQERETFTLDKKIKETQLKKYELDPNFDPEIHAQQKDLLSKQYKQASALYDLQSAIQEAAKKGETAKLTELQKEAQAISNIYSGFKIGAAGAVTTPNINIDEQIKRKVATTGIESLTPEEKPLWERMNKVNTQKPTLWDLQKEARTTVNSALQNNPELQGKVFENPAMLTDLIDKEVGRLQTRYMGSAETNKQNTNENVLSLPEGVSEEDITHTLKIHPEYTRESLIKKLGGK